MEYLPQNPAILASSVRSSSARSLPTGRENVCIHTSLDWQKHHETLHKGWHQIKYGAYLILIAQIALWGFSSCKTKQRIETALPVRHEYAPEHSPSVFIVMYDQEAGKDSLLKAVKDYKAEIIYDYSIIPGMAIRKPDDKTLEESMQYFKKVKGVVSVEYDHIYRLTDPVKPKLEIE